MAGWEVRSAEVLGYAHDVLELVLDIPPALSPDTAHETSLRLFPEREGLLDLVLAFLRKGYELFPPVLSGFDAHELLFLDRNEVAREGALVYPDEICEFSEIRRFQMRDRHQDYELVALEVGVPERVVVVINDETRRLPGFLTYAVETFCELEALEFGVPVPLLRIRSFLHL